MSTILLRALQVLAVLGALWAAVLYLEGRGYDRAKAEDQSQFEKLKREAADTLAMQTERVRERELYLNAVTDNQNRKDSIHEKTIAALDDRLRRLADPAGRLRDPQAIGCGTGSGSTSEPTAPAAADSAADRTEAGGVLSAELSGLLQRLGAEADAINLAYTSCRADSYTIRKPL